MAPNNATQHYPLYNTTLSIHRISPLYTGTNEPLDNAALYQHARRFRDILAGEVLRGVRIGLAPEDDALARVGALQTVTWRLLPEEDAWTADDEVELGEDNTMAQTVSRGLILQVVYEKMTYKAIMLRDDHSLDDSRVSDREEGDGFQQFPLLLSKMPGPLRDTFVQYLGTTFDARVSTLRLSSAYLTNAFERYLADVSTGGDGDPMETVDASKSIRKVIKETAIFLGFDLPGGPAALKTIDIQIAREDLPRMISKGKTGQGDGGLPFFNALTAYIKAHLALDLRHERVRVAKIGCAAFALGEDGKIKLTQPLVEEDGDSPQSRATRRLIHGLVKVASMEGSLLSKPAT